jgi:hypothetical protein
MPASIASAGARSTTRSINLYGELIQRLSALPDRSAKMDAAALLVAVRTLKPDVDLERDRVEGLAGTQPNTGLRRKARLRPLANRENGMKPIGRFELRL